MATIHSARPHLSGSNLNSKPNSKSDFTDLFGPLEDRGPTTRIVRVPRLGYSSTLSRPPGQQYNPPPQQQPMPGPHEPSMFNSNFATMQSGPYGLGRADSLHLGPASNSMPYSSAPFPYSTVPAGMPINKTPYASTDVTTVSPLQTTFDTASPYGSYVDFDAEPQSAISSQSSFVMLGMSSGSSSRKRSSAESREESDSDPSTSKKPSGGRRQKSSPAIDSARERYLEKNRRAATKCRTKQKQQQEDLVENARDAERRNKLLRAEVHILREDMRELMAVVGEHSHCPDNRLRMYVQREADRLATGAPRSPDIGRTSVRSSDSSRGGSRSAQSSD